MIFHPGDEAVIVKSVIDSRGNECLGSVVTILSDRIRDYVSDRYWYQIVGLVSSAWEDELGVEPIKIPTLAEIKRNKLK